MTETALVPASDGQLTSSQILAGLNTVKAVLAPDLTGDELKLFAMVAARSGLDPFAKQIYAIKRKGRVTFQTGIDGYRSIAVRTGFFDGQDEPEYGATCACGDKRPDGHPESATVRVYRKGVSRPIAATAYWHEYKPEGGQSGLGDAMWMRMPRVMIAKVAEALALRKAFPYDPERREGIGADLYTADEMAQAGKADAAASAAAAPTAAARLAQRRAAVEAPKAQPVTDATPAGEPGPETVDGYFVEDPGPDGVLSVDNGLTSEQFRALVEEVGASKDRVGELGRELFPGIARFGDLDDAQRGQLWDRLSSDQAVEQTA